MFQNEKNAFEQVIECIVDYKPIYVFSGIGKSSKLLKEGEDYQGFRKRALYLPHHSLTHLTYLIDVYSEALWPERFTPKVMEERRKRMPHD